MSLSDLFSALADPTRLRVLEMLHEAPRPVHELAAAFDISRPAISRHLRVLKDAGLVKEVKQGRENRYSLQHTKLKAGLKWLAAHEVAKVVAKPPKPDRAPAPKKIAAPAVPADPIVLLAAELAPHAAPPDASAQSAVKLAEDLAVASKPRPTRPAASPQLSFFDL